MALAAYLVVAWISKRIGGTWRNALLWPLYQFKLNNPVETPKAFTNPGGTATPEELAYTDYLTNWVDPTPDDKFDNAPVSFGEWVTGIRVKTTTSLN